MTLDEAITHAEDVAKEQDKLSKRYDDASGYSRSHNDDIRTSDAKKCERCAEDHRQLARWLKDYKRLKEQQPCEECISRQAVLDAMSDTWKHICSVARRKHPTKGEEAVYNDMWNTVRQILPVTPQAKTGQWVDKDIRGSIEPYCSVCGDSVDTIYHYDYCPNCGTKMKEVEE